eukprot:359596-Chlamydomonas_euryale.AAC.1
MAQRGATARHDRAAARHDRAAARHGRAAARHDRAASKHDRAAARHDRAAARHGRAAARHDRASGQTQHAGAVHAYYDSRQGATCTATCTATGPRDGQPLKYRTCVHTTPPQVRATDSPDVLVVMGAQRSAQQ